LAKAKRKIHLTTGAKASWFAAGSV
jgi:hypothetical protein